MKIKKIKIWPKKKMIKNKKNKNLINLKIMRKLWLQMKTNKLQMAKNQKKRKMIQKIRKNRKNKNNQLKNQLLNLNKKIHSVKKYLMLRNYFQKLTLL